MVPGPDLSKSIRKELFPVSTRPPAGFPAFDPGLRSEGNALVMALDGPASAPPFRRRMNRKAPIPIAARPPTPAMRIHGLSMRSSMKPFSGGGGAFLAAAGLVSVL